MSTFRNNQISEILNIDRRLNRTILDRTQQHVNSIQDEKSAPTTRDIKLEASIGEQIDGIKEQINKAIQLITPFKYGKLDSDRAERVLKAEEYSQSAIPDRLIKKAIAEASKPPEPPKPKPPRPEQLPVYTGSFDDDVIKEDDDMFSPASFAPW
jgi:hypothetical protein